MTGSSPKPEPPTIITDPSALNDRTENTPALTLYSADDNNLESNPPSPLFDAKPKPDDTKSSNPVNIEKLLQYHGDPQNPFAFTIDQLYAMFDPKNIDLLVAFGGLEGIAKGLHSNIKDGLSNHENAPFEPITLSQLIDSDNVEHPKLEDECVSPPAPSPTQHTSANTRFAQRQAVFGTNTLPEVKGNNIFQLMWMAFKDKTLVCITTAFEEFEIYLCNSKPPSPPSPKNFYPLILPP
jgi:hypothetical protein